METNAETNAWLALIAICLFVIAFYCAIRMTREMQFAEPKRQRLRAGFTALPFATQ